MKSLCTPHGQGTSIRSISRNLGISRNTVRSPDVPKRGSKLAAYHGYLRQRLADGVDNCVILLRELRQLGYSGGYSILKDYLKPLRRRPASETTVRFETEPGEQAQADWGSFSYQTPEGKTRTVWGFVMVLSWSRAMHVEFVRHPDLSNFIRCHLNAFSHLGIPRRCYDNTKLVVSGRDGDGLPVWNQRFLDFSRRLGVQRAAVPAVSSSDKGESGARREVPIGQFLASGSIDELRGPEPPGRGLGEHRGQPEDPRHDP